MHALLTRLRSLWRNLVHGRRVDHDLDDEVRAIVDLLADEKMLAGATRDEGRRAAAVEIGGAEQIKELVREVKTGARLEALWHDVRFGTRLLRRSPSFAAAAIVSLALGIGANSAVFGLLNALRLRSLPVAHPEQLAEVRLDGPRCCRHTGRNRQVSVPLWREIAQHQQAFSGLFAFADTRFNLAPQGEVRYVEALYVSGEFFDVLGVEAALGRTLSRNDDRAGCGTAGAVISHALWQSEFGGRADVLSQTIAMRSARHPIVGVMPPEFFGVEVGRRFEVALPICASGFDRADHWWLGVMGRLKPGWSVAQANAHMAALGPSLLRAAVPPTYDAESTRRFVELPLSVRDARNGVSPLRTQYEQPLWLLLGIAALVLVTACANVASLSVVRATARETEIALRFALGASKLRVVRQLLVEGALIAIAGAAAGLILARVVHDGTLRLLSTSTDPIRLGAGLDWRTIAFTTAVVAVTTLAFAVGPAIRVLRGSLGSTSRVTAASRRAIAREALAGIQIAMAVVLVSGAILFIVTARTLLTDDTGFNSEGLVVANIFLPAELYPPPARRPIQRELTARLAALPGVAGAAHATTPPLGGSTWGPVVRVPSASGETKHEVVRNQVSAGYFAVMEMPLIAGRDFSDADTPTTPRRAIVNSTFARELMGEPQPLGRRFFDGDQEFEIVGIVGDSKQYMLREPFRAIFYTAASQVIDPGLTMRFVVRTRVDAGQTIADVRRMLADLSSTASVRFATYPEMVVAAGQRERLMANLSGFFGIIALVLAAVGVYGIVAFTAASRRREIGIRIALGAGSADVLKTVVGRTAIVAASGVLAGLVLTIPLSDAAASMLYGVQPRDPATIAAILSVIALSALAAAAVPARRALRTDPVVALKSE